MSVCTHNTCAFTRLICVPAAHVYMHRQQEKPQRHSKLTVFIICTNLKNSARVRGTCRRNALLSSKWLAFGGLSSFSFPLSVQGTWQKVFCFNFFSRDFLLQFCMNSRHFCAWLFAYVCLLECYSLCRQLFKQRAPWQHSLRCLHVYLFQPTGSMVLLLQPNGPACLLSDAACDATMVLKRIKRSGLM
jgi:hypothetical protein